MKSRRNFYCSAGLLAATIAVSAASAQQTTAQIQFDIAPQPLKYALRNVTRASGLQLFAMSRDLAGKNSSGLHGRMSTQEALDQLLAGTGLTAQIDGGSVFIRGRSETMKSVEPSLASGGTEILVTGSRIRGAAVTSPVLTISQADIRNSGYTSVGDVVRALPQNFSGGQNPGVGLTVPASNGENVGSGTAINLRGLGQDATLTLLNGHRVSNGGNRQSVDVSSIPVDAIDRIEIITDGASALYGSDAVGGVANIILKKDYRGVMTSANWGGATDGGDSHQQYDITAGDRWDHGGFILAYDFNRNTPILSSQRSYTATQNPGLTLYPALRQHNILLYGHYDLTDRISFRLDSAYTNRTDHRSYATTANGSGPVYDVRYHSSALSVSPSVQWSISDSWTASLAGTYGFDDSHYRQLSTTAGVTTPVLQGCYCNSTEAVEAKGDGTLLSLPGGGAKIALGGGYRRDTFHAFRSLTSVPLDADVAQSDRYAFAELNLPVFGHANARPLLRALTLNVAGRFDDYPGIGRVATPKLGIIYAPSDDVELKGSWGRSFKAPTLYQRYNVQYATLYNAATLGGSGYPSTATAILLTGGQPNLKPERATTWSGTLAIHPRSISGLHIEATYFHINYRDRVVMPITLLAQSLSNPAYAGMITASPSAALQEALLSQAAWYNYSGGSYVPANVVAIVDDRNVNIASQRIQGVDLSASYATHVTPDIQLTLSSSVSYLDSKQKLLPTASYDPLSGTYYNPPHVRARFGAAIDGAQLSLSAFLNYIGGERDVRYVPEVHVSGMATLDLTARYRLAERDGALGGVELFLAVQDLNNAKPDQTRTAGVYDAAYDTTNYSPTGRFISGGIRKHW